MKKEQIDSFSKVVQQIKVAPEQVTNYEVIGTWMSLLKAFRVNEATMVEVSRNTRVNTINNAADSLVALFINLIKFGQLIGADVDNIINSPMNSTLDSNKRDLNLSNIFYNGESFFKDLGGDIMTYAQKGDRSSLNLNQIEEKIKMIVSLSKFTLSFYGIKPIALIFKADLVSKQLLQTITQTDEQD